jgi:hypothetical protein
MRYVWDMERIRAAMNGSPNQQVNLAHPIPVLIVYDTVIVTEDGMESFIFTTTSTGTTLRSERFLRRVIRIRINS